MKRDGTAIRHEQPARTIADALARLRHAERFEEGGRVRTAPQRPTPSTLRLDRDGRRLTVWFGTQTATVTGRSVEAAKDMGARLERWEGRGRPRDGQRFTDLRELLAVAEAEREAALRFRDFKDRRSMRGRRW